MTEIMKPLFKYPGGKSSEYKHIKHLFPDYTTYVEPFLGGGAIYWALKAEKYIINDFSPEVTAIYSFVKEQNQKFFEYIEDLITVWDIKESFVDTIAKDMECDNIEDKELKNITNKILGSLRHNNIYEKTKLLTFLKQSITQKKNTLSKFAKNENIDYVTNTRGMLGAALYTLIRDKYNNITLIDDKELKVALYFFLREYSYSGMFRFNIKGKFNVPFGGNSYAKKSLQSKYNQMKDKSVVEKLRNTEIYTGDFSFALIDKEDTFIFLDPPYNSAFSTYNSNVFDKTEQERLRDNLLNIKKSKWLMVIKSTNFIEELYKDDKFYKLRFNKSYSVNFKNRNDRGVQHLIISNYPLEVH